MTILGYIKHEGNGDDKQRHDCGSEIPANITVLALPVVGGLYLAVKIFHTYMLMYGKRLSLKETPQSTEGLSKSAGKLI